MGLVLGVTPAIAHDPDGSFGQRLYLPVYSEIPHGSGRDTYRLAATLSIRNTDPDAEISIMRADYYDSDGKLLERYLKEPVKLGPLASTHVVVKESRIGGPSGALAWSGNYRSVQSGLPWGQKPPVPGVTPGHRGVTFGRDPSVTPGVTERDHRDHDKSLSFCPRAFHPLSVVGIFTHAVWASRLCGEGESVTGRVERWRAVVGHVVGRYDTGYVERYEAAATELP